MSDFRFHASWPYSSLPPCSFSNPFSSQNVLGGLIFPNPNQHTHQKHGADQLTWFSSTTSLPITGSPLYTRSYNGRIILSISYYILSIFFFSATFPAQLWWPLLASRPSATGKPKSYHRGCTVDGLGPERKTQNRFTTISMYSRDFMKLRLSSPCTSILPPLTFKNVQHQGA